MLTKITQKDRSMMPCTQATQNRQPRRYRRQNRGNQGLGEEGERSQCFNGYRDFDEDDEKVWGIEAWLSHNTMYLMPLNYMLTVKMIDNYVLPQSKLQSTGKDVHWDGGR